jgi:hypothetical protein
MQKFITIILISILCQACGPQTTKLSQAPLDPEQRAAQLVRTGQFSQAAAEYLQLAQLYPNNSAGFQLNAASAYLSARDPDSALAVLEAVIPSAADSEVNKRKYILLAKVDLEKNRPAAALARLRNLTLGDTPDTLLAELFETRSKAFELAGNPGSAVRERVAMDKYLEGEEDRQLNYNSIWQDLNQMDTVALNRFRSVSSGELKSWIELAIINQTLLLDADMLDQSVTMWIQQYPRHPAIAITANILANSRQNTFRPVHIALLLPFTGQYQLVSETIRDGFIAGWYNSENFKPEISIYQADSLNILDAYQQAIANGAEFIVGPLEREAVTRLAGTGNLPVKVLALNQYQSRTIETLAPATTEIPGIVQFSLLPEDEARQVAAGAFAKGHRKALVILRNDDFDYRIYEAFSDQWAALGGKIMSRTIFDPETEDFSTPVRQLLNVSSSDKRAARLQQRLNRSIKSESRLREDADMIFLVARPEEARQLVPQLRFFRAEHMPIYSSSRIFSGITNAQLDKDLNNVSFTDSPWVLRDDKEISALHNTVNRIWQADRSRYNRFYAFGIDAFRIIPHLGRLAVQSTIPYHGATGDLYLTPSGNISRKLVWASFREGVPVIDETGNGY